MYVSYLKMDTYLPTFLKLKYAWNNFHINHQNRVDLFHPNTTTSVSLRKIHITEFQRIMEGHYLCNESVQE